MPTTPTLTNKLLIATVGLPYSGKSTWAVSQPWTVVSPDAIRLALHGQRFCREAEPMVWVIAKLMVRSLFLAGHSVVVLDATNLQRKYRDDWKSPDWDLRFKAILTPLEYCLERAQRADDQYILPIISRMAETQEPLGDDERQWMTT